MTTTTATNKKDYSKMTDKELHHIKKTAFSRSREFAEARKELNRRASLDPRNNISIGVPNPPNLRQN